MTTTTSWRRGATLLTLALSIALTACGGGGDGGDSGGQANQSSTSSSSSSAAPARASSSGVSVAMAPAVAVGTVNGFGSVLVDGTRFDDTGATVEVEIEPGAPKAIALRDLRIGQSVTVEFDGNESAPRARAFRVEGELVGVVDSVDAAGKKLVVAGQDVRINTDAAAGPVTTFDGYQSLADVKAGERVEVHGLPKLDAATNKLYVQATRIERKADNVQFVRVTGTIANLAATTFDLGGLKVTYAATTRLIPADAKLANGQRVVVWSDTAVVGNALTAKAIRVRGEIRADKAWLGGPITDCVAACVAKFKVNGIEVDASEAKFANGDAAKLANGVFVRVRGSFDATAARVKATQVVFRDDNEMELELWGMIAGYKAGNDGTATFTVRGVPIKTSATTKLDNCPAVLVDGTPVKVEGRIDGNVLAAAEVKCLPMLDRLRGEVRGPIGTVDAAGKKFTLVNLPNLPIAFDPATTKFEDGTAAQLVVGAVVEVEGNVKDGTLVATEIEFKGAMLVGERSVKGIVFGFDAQTGVFKVGQLTFQVGGAALPAGFANGVQVEVRYMSANGVNTVVQVKLKN